MHEVVRHLVCCSVTLDAATRRCGEEELVGEALGYWATRCSSDIQQANGLYLVEAAVARVCYSESGAESAGSSSTHQVRTLTNSRIPAAASSRP
jgi:hypothetical protein